MYVIIRSKWQLSVNPYVRRLWC